MEFYTYPSHHFPPSSSPSSSESYSSFGFIVNKIKEFIRCAVSAVVGNVFSAIFTFFFALGQQFFPSFSYMLCFLMVFPFPLFFEELSNSDSIFHIFVICACCLWVPLILVWLVLRFVLFHNNFANFVL